MVWGVDMLCYGMRILTLLCKPFHLVILMPFLLKMVFNGVLLVFMVTQRQCRGVSLRTFFVTYIW